MLKAYDVECKECGKVEEQFIDHREESFEPCSECGCEMKRIFDSCNFKLLYDPKKDRVGWAFNNYGESQYWRDFRKARYEEGRDVRPANEEP